jgi:4-hydroxyphenylpyruvate dioxygenase-like putative hemolysin
MKRTKETSPGGAALSPEGFRNSDERLRERAEQRIEARRRHGLKGLVGGLESVVINTEPEHQQAAVAELLARTGLALTDAFEDEAARTVVLSTAGSADVLVTARKGPSPFAAFTDRPKSRRLASTRLESFTFTCRDLAAYEAIQRDRGVQFLTAGPVIGEGFRYLQTLPSAFTGNSIGLIEREGDRRSYRPRGATEMDWRFEKPSRDYLDRIGRLDHTATRVEAADRDAAILEFLGLTNYHFAFAIYVESLNSITSVARLSDKDFAMVFTSGIAPFVDASTSGPTERFIHNYGPRVHHMAWETEGIDDVFDGLKADGQEFLLELVGSPDEGLKQTFSAMSPHTLLVNEYIHRYGDFDGFFTRSNVTLLTEATEKQ